MTKPKIIYTYTDEAPALATESLLPLIQAFVKQAGIDVETKDISLAGRILCKFPECLPQEKQVEDALTALGKLAKTAEANIIKLPNISASIPQLVGAIKELQGKGFAIPDYPAEPANAEEEAIRQKYATVLGSAVNPVLREGNSDRRVAPPVKAYAKKNPHSMGAWESTSKTHVASMPDSDFFESEASWVAPSAETVTIEHVAEDGTVTTLKSGIALQEGEVIDGARLSCKALRAYFADQIQKAQDEGVLLSLHMKATMMKVSDPIIFGHAVSVYYQAALEHHEPLIKDMGFNPNNGIGDLYSKAELLPDHVKKILLDDVEAVYENRPPLAMVDSDRGITNLHVPSDIIIDASMPAAIRSSGKMWGPDGKLADTKALIPDRSYAAVYQATIDYCKDNGAFDPSTMGNVANVGLMAQKAEEYGSHDKTFEIASAGLVRVMNQSGEEVFSHSVEAGDIWRMCQTKDAPIKDWVKLAVNRAKATGVPVVFWLNENRAHDASLIAKVKAYLPEHDTSDLEILIKAPKEATEYTLDRVGQGLDTISATGNVLRDYLTDLFPILELGTSAKMLSIVPLLSGGGLFETGAGGTAPKHVQQLVEEGHLRWDSLGEFLALGVSLEHLSEQFDIHRAATLAAALNAAIGRVLDEGKSPSRKVGQLDNRGSHFYLALYWSQELANQSDDEELSALFQPFADALTENESTIVGELADSEGTALDIGGYYRPDPELAAAAMRPSQTLNGIIDSFS